MSTPLTVGKARLSTVAVITGGVPDATTPLSNVREALIDRWGGKAKALGVKADRKLKRAAMTGPLSGIAGDVWSALAVAVTWSDMRSSIARTP